MARPRMPAHKREAAAAANNESRFSNLPDTPTSDVIGPVSDWLDPFQRETWAWAVREWWWLAEADRPLLEMICVYRSMVILDTATPEQRRHYSALLSKIGATPVDRSKVDLPKTPNETEQDNIAKRFVR